MQFHFGEHVTGRRPARAQARLGCDCPVEPQVFDVLVYLIHNRDRVVSKDDLIAGVWDGRVVSESTLASRINAVRKAVGDSGEEQQLIRTIARKGIRFVGAGGRGPKRMSLPRNPTSGTCARPHQEMKFCRAADGIASPSPRRPRTAADQGRELAQSPRIRLGEPDLGSCCWTLAETHRLIRYDARGNGLSDWEVKDISFDAFVRDLETVVDAAAWSASRSSASRRAPPSRSPTRCGIRARNAAHPLRRLRPGAEQARPGPDRNGRLYQSDPPGLGRRALGLPAGLHLAVLPERHRRADQMVADLQRSRPRPRTRSGPARSTPRST